MGEGILIYGLHGSKRRYTRDLQGFADKVLASGQARKSVYIFGKTNKVYLRDLSQKGIAVKSDIAAITDKTILKYRNHPKKQKGATKPLSRLAKELNLAICCLLGSPATDATINLFAKVKRIFDKSKL